jgi:hypothetical protein
MLKKKGSPGATMQLPFSSVVLFRVTSIYLCNKFIVLIKFTHQKIGYYLHRQVLYYQYQVGLNFCAHSNIWGSIEICVPTKTIAYAVMTKLAPTYVVVTSFAAKICCYDDFVKKISTNICCRDKFCGKNMLL